MTTSKRRRSQADSLLARWIEDRGRTQVWLAHRLGISVASMSRIVRGATMPRAKLALQIQALTGITVAELVRAKATSTTANKAARKRYAQELIKRGTSLLAAVSEEA